MDLQMLRRGLGTSMLVLGGSLLLFAGDATAQDADLAARISADSERRIEQIEEEARIRQEGPGVIADEMARQELPPPGGPTVQLTGINFEPESAFLSEEELGAIRARYIGRAIDFRGISELVRDVNDLYAEKGIVTAAAVLPPQDLGGGVLTVSLVEGQVGAVGVVGENETKSSYILNRVRYAVGTTVDVPTASRDIAYFNQTNSAQLRLLLQPGASFGMTDLLFGVTEPPKNQFQVFIDNKGVASTGALQASFVYRRYGLLGIDDTFLLFGALSEGSLAGTARYDFPISTRGLRLALSYTQSDIQVVSGPTAGLDITGESRSATATLTQPFLANDTWAAFGTFSAFHGLSASWTGGAPQVDAETVKLAPGVSLSYTGDRGMVSTDAQLVFAEVDDRILSSKESHFLAAGSIAGNYQFDNDLTLVGRGGWQWTRSQLLPGNLLFQIGGPSTVRGYPSDGVAGDSGYYGNLELHRRFSHNGFDFGGYAFTDFGQVFSTFAPTTSMVSVGVGATYDFSEHARLEVSLAIPLANAVANQSGATISAGLTLSRF